MPLQPFTENFADNSTEAGFQFTFFCDLCQEGYKTTFIESKTYRMHGHTAMDRFHLGGYRPKEEVEEWERKDPVKRLRARLLEMKTMSEAELKEIEGKAKEEIEEAEKCAKESPYPTVEELFQDVYVE